ncbi:hypothetical protein ANN_24932 [Periplaneta americana]|uniref:Reverse transcriptase domain-containing protein n=1 Tax=Periplaneta americana TaxID=6978 RepID=A0ABQ8S054_PERAM|nr:hypothetical protein ANN_24932 [Periplaneta americana]
MDVNLVNSVVMSTDAPCEMQIERGCREKVANLRSVDVVASPIVLHTLARSNMGVVIVGGRRIKYIRFADDMALLAEEEMILREMLELNDSCEQYGMKINAKKKKKRRRPWS